MSKFAFTPRYEKMIGRNLTFVAEWTRDTPFTSGFMAFL